MEPVDRLLERLDKREYVVYAQDVTGRGMTFDRKPQTMCSPCSPAETMDHFFDHTQLGEGIVATGDAIVLQSTLQ